MSCQSACEARSDLSVSVIIPTYNREHFVGASIDAVLAQLRPGDELIVVNDGSPDNTDAVLTTYGDRIRVVNQENKGKAAALNSGLGQATRELVWIVDDDDIVASDARDRLVRALIKSPDAGFAYGRHDRFRERADSELIDYFDTGYWCDCPPEEFLIHSMEDLFAHHPGMMVRRSVYDAIGGFDASLDRSEDYEMTIRLGIYARPVAVDGILFHQRQHSGDRGSGAKKVREIDRERNWILNDQAIFLRFFDSLDLSFYLPDRQLDKPSLLRQAHLERGTILARRHLWGRAIDELEIAVNIDVAGAKLSEEERKIVRRWSGSKFGCMDLVRDSDIYSRLAGLAKTSRLGSEIAYNISRSLWWRIRQHAQQGQFADAWAYAAFSAKLIAKVLLSSPPADASR